MTVVLVVLVVLLKLFHGVGYSLEEINTSLHPLPFYNVEAHMLASSALNTLFFFFFCFLGLHLQHMEVPRLGVELELQLPVYATATTWNWSPVCDLHHSLWQCWIFNLLSKARDETFIHLDAIGIHFL